MNSRPPIWQAPWAAAGRQTPESAASHGFQDVFFLFLAANNRAMETVECTELLWRLTGSEVAPLT